MMRLFRKVLKSAASPITWMDQSMTWNCGKIEILIIPAIRMIWIPMTIQVPLQASVTINLPTFSFCSNLFCYYYGKLQRIELKLKSDYYIITSLCFGFRIHALNYGLIRIVKKKILSPAWLLKTRASLRGNPSFKYRSNF